MGLSIEAMDAESSVVYMPKREVMCGFVGGYQTSNYCGSHVSNYSNNCYSSHNDCYSNVGNYNTGSYCQPHVAVNVAVNLNLSNCYGGGSSYCNW